MSLLSVVQQVCSVVGVNRPTSIFSGINANRTAQEMLDLANEMAQRIAYNTRDWQTLIARAIFTGTGSESFPMPANYQRMLLSSNVWRSTSALQPLRFIPNADEWLQRRMRGYNSAWGEWMLQGGQMFIWPIMPMPTASIPLVPPWVYGHAYSVGNIALDLADNTFWNARVDHVSGGTSTSPYTFAEDRGFYPSYWAAVSVSPISTTATFNYLDKNCVRLTSGGFGDTFMADTDSFRLDERLLKLAMIWQWKANKGSPYAEDMANYQDALERVAGADKPAPIIIDRLPMSAAVQTAYPFPITLGSDGRPI